MRKTILAGFACLVACGGGTAPAPSEMTVTVEQPLTDCPSTVSGTNGHTCGKQDLRCTIPVTCPTIDQQVTCTCEKGVFSCTDAMGPLAKGEEPRCAHGPEDDTIMCPPSFETADGASCSEVGRTCAYPGFMCPNRAVQLTDYCQCKRDPADGTMTLVCAQSACPPG